MARKAPEKCSTNENVFLNLLQRGIRGLKEFLDELSREVQGKSCTE